MDLFELFDFFFNFVLQNLLKVSLEFLYQSHDWVSKFGYLLIFVTAHVVTFVVVQVALDSNEFCLEVSVGADDWESDCVNDDVVVGAVFFDVDFNIVCFDLRQINCDDIMLYCNIVIGWLLLTRCCFCHILINFGNIKWPIPCRIKHLIVASSTIYHALHFFE